MTTDAQKAGRQVIIDLVRARVHAELDGEGTPEYGQALTDAMHGLSAITDVIGGITGALDAASAILTLAVMADDQGGVTTPPAEVRRRLEAVLLTYEPLAGV